MAKSSIHIEAGNIGFFSHNDRSRPTKNSIFSDEKNFVNCSSRESIKIYKDELEKRTQAYLKNHSTRKKLHSKTHTHLSAIVNLNKEHTPDDLKKVVEHIEKTFDTKVLQFSIHKDEGHISDNGESIKNYHAHIEMMGLDSEGNSIKRQLHRKELIALQSATAELLGMERGTNYSKERKPRPKRLNTYEYKESKEQESKAKRATAKDLKGEIKQLREQLQEQGAVREQYAELEALNRELKERVKAKDLSIEELRNLANRKIKDEYRVNRNLQKLLSEARETILDHKTTIDTQKDDLERYEQNMSDLKLQNKELQSEVTQTLANNDELKLQITSLNAERSDEERALQAGLDEISEKIDKLLPNDYEGKFSISYMSGLAVERFKVFTEFVTEQIKQRNKLEQELRTYRGANRQEKRKELNATNSETKKLQEALIKIEELENQVSSLKDEIVNFNNEKMNENIDSNAVENSFENKDEEYDYGMSP